VGLAVEDIEGVSHFAPGHCPAGEATGGFHNIPLSITAMDTQGVKLQKLTGVVFVRLLRIVPLPVFTAIEIKEHRRTQSGSLEKIAEIAEGVRPDDGSIVHGLEPAAVQFGGVDVKVVGPKADHHFIQLPPAVDGADDGLAGEFVVQLRGLVLVKFGDRLTNGLQRSERGMGEAVLDFVRIQLLVHEEAKGLLLCRGEGADALVFTGRDAPRQAIQHVGDEVHALARGRLKGNECIRARPDGQSANKFL
jgi:hypothetical protein